jgi:hypothetical protein
MKLGITGTRRFFDYDTIEQDILAQFPDTTDITMVISGGAKGVDNLCEQFARKFNIPIDSHKPDYDTHGKGAPLVRNREIVEKCDILMGWPLKNPTSFGTISTIEYAKKLGKQVIVNEVEEDNMT